LLRDVLRASDLRAVVPTRLATEVTDLAIAKPPVAVPGFTRVAVWHDRIHNDVALRWTRPLVFGTVPDRV